MYHCVINYKNANHPQKSNIMKTKIIHSLVCILFAAKLRAQNWLLNGNAATTATQFIGTTDAKDLRLNSTLYNFIQTFFSSVKNFNASNPPSRPTPEFFIPPKGVRKSRRSQQLIHTIPL